MNSQDQNQLAFAQKYFDVGRIDLAKPLLQKLLTQHPKQPQVLEILGYIAGNEGDLESATDYLTRCIQAEPRNGSAAYYLGYCLQQKSKHSEAAMYFRQAIDTQGPFAEGLRNLAFSLRAQGELAESLECLAQAKQLEPKAPDILYDYAVAMHESKLHDEALDTTNELLKHSQSSDAYLLRARIYLSLGNQSSAVADIESSLRGNPKDAMTWANCAAIFFESGQYEQAIKASETAIALDPTHLLTWLNYSAALQKTKRLSQAVQACTQAISIDASCATAWLNKAMAHGELLETDLAIESYRQAKRHGAIASQIEYALAAYGAENAPDASPTDYVVTLFDNYAARFDEHLMGSLEYRVPQVMGRVLRDHCDSSLRGFVLDLGCGTGLFGPDLLAFSTKLIGVDLSPKMIEVARNRGVYSDLAVSEVLLFLQDQLEKVRLAVALDVFVYIGKLDAIFAQVKRLSQPGSEFAFSVEEHHGQEPFKLLPSLRYAHSEAYIAELCHLHGFDIVVKEALTSRKERGQPIQGKIFLLRSR